VLSSFVDENRHADGSLEYQGFQAQARPSVCISGPIGVNSLFAAQHGGLLPEGVGKLAGVVVV
jgi:hypothetical protein